MSERTFSRILARLRYALAATSTILLLSPAVAGDGPGTKNLTLLGIGSGTVAPSGLVFASLGYAVANDCCGTFSSTSAAVGFGMGNADESLGVQFMTNFNAIDQGFGRSGYFQLKFSRRISEERPLYLGLSIEQIGGWGTAQYYGPSSKLALSYFTSFEAGGNSYPVMMTAGYGSHTALVEPYHDYYVPGFFAGVGVGITDQFGVSLAETGAGLTAGVSYRPRNLSNLSINLSVDDALNQFDTQVVNLSVNWFTKNAFGG